MRKPWLHIFDAILKLDGDAVENMCEQIIWLNASYRSSDLLCWDKQMCKCLSEMSDSI